MPLLEFCQIIEVLWTHLQTSVCYITRRTHQDEKTAGASLWASHMHTTFFHICWFKCDIEMTNYGSDSFLPYSLTICKWQRSRALFVFTLKFPSWGHFGWGAPQDLSWARSLGRSTLGGLGMEMDKFPIAANRVATCSCWWRVSSMIPKLVWNYHPNLWEQPSTPSREFHFPKLWVPRDT